METNELAEYKTVQNAARHTLNTIIGFIKPGVTELDIVHKCDQLQHDAGVDGYWYKSLPALVLSGEHTTLPISREPYVPSEQPIQENDLITIDLNPSISGYCGDYARSYYVEAGVTRRIPKSNDEFLAGYHAQKQLHAKLAQVASPSLTFNDLYHLMRKKIDQLGFDQLDYLGHGVQKDMQNLDFISPEVACSLQEIGFFTLEPHIRLKGGRYGFKHENIYYFDSQTLKEL